MVPSGSEVAAGAHRPLGREASYRQSWASAALPKLSSVAVTARPRKILQLVATRVAKSSHLGRLRFSGLIPAVAIAHSCCWQKAAPFGHNRQKHAGDYVAPLRLQSCTVSLSTAQDHP